MEIITGETDNMIEYKMNMTEYKIMNEALTNFKNNMGKDANYYTWKTYSVRIMRKDYEDAKKRVNDWYKKNKKLPNYVLIKNAVKVKLTPNKSALRLAVEDAVGSFSNMNEFYNRLMKKSYKYYNNDVYPQKEAIKRLKNNTGLNCADVSQITYAVAIDLGLNPTYWRGLFKCGGHIWITTSGDKHNQFVFDGAAAFKGIKQGQYLCKGSPTELVKNAKWLINDDGKT